MSVAWSYYDDYEYLNDKYLPEMGEGETMATQIVTAVAKLVYKWYNDGDVFDNTYAMIGWCNDLSSYANWLYKHTECNDILTRIAECFNDDDYEDLLQALAVKLLDEKLLEEMNRKEKVGSIYKCEGPFKYEEEEDEEEW